MPVHSVFIVNSAGNILFSKYFTAISSSDEVVFQQSLFQNCSFYFSKEITNQKHSVTVKNVYCVFQKFGEFIVIINGLDDIDEPILSTILDALAKLLLDTLENKLQETLLVNSEYYGKFAVALDEMIPQGQLETLDIDLISKLSKLKNI